MANLCRTLGLLAAVASALPALAANDRRDLLDLSIEELGEIVVAGTRIRGVEVPVPTIVITRDEFENTGFATVEQLFERLPQNFDEVTPDGRFANEGGSLLRGLNNTRVSAIDLRGLGAQSTLTLVNGKRRAGSIEGRVVDISAIPLSIIERVEVVTGGRSAIYGADAVAGVVNLVTRAGFEGAELQVYYGASDDGGERLQLSQIVGIESGRGALVAAYDFTRDWALELGDAGLLSLAPNPAIGLTQLSLNAKADTWKHSAYLSGRTDVTERVQLYADALWSDRKFEDFALRHFAGASENSFTDVVNPDEHLSLTGGVRADVRGDWTLDFSGGWSRSANSSRTANFIDLGFISISREVENDTTASLPNLSAVAEGPLPAIGRLIPRGAVGAEWRKEKFARDIDDMPESNLDRSLRSVFAELSVPLVEQGQRGLRHLELSLAGRYDNYSDFGGTFNPQAGAIWIPVEGLALRAAYSSAFRAPALVELDSSVDAFLEPAPDPSQNGALVPILFTQGENPDLQAEEADTWSIGVDFEPEFASWAKVSLSYFHVDYDGRIEQPTVNADRELVLQRAERFPGLLTRNPAAAEAASFLDADADGFIDNDTGVPFDPATQNILDVFPNLVLFDNRTSNIAVEELRGMDLTIKGSFETGIGQLNFGVNLAHTFEHVRKVTAASPSFSLLDEVGKPAATRARATGGWTRGPYGAHLYVNFVDSYANPFSIPDSAIGSWTTVDLTLRLNGSELRREGLLNGVGATFSIDNLFDNDPPLFPNSLQGVLYDATNADPFGRYLSLRLSKDW